MSDVRDVLADAMRWSPEPPFHRPRWLVGADIADALRTTTWIPLGRPQWNRYEHHDQTSEDLVAAMPAITEAIPVLDDGEWEDVPDRPTPMRRDRTGPPMHADRWRR